MSFRTKIKNLLTRRNLLIALLIVVLLSQYWYSSKNSSNLSSLRTRESSLIDEVGQLKETYLKVGTDLNEVRQFLRLPVNDYRPIEAPVADEEEGKNKDKVQLALFQYVDYLANAKNVKEKLAANKALIDNLLISKDFSKFLVTQNLAFAPTVRDENGATLKINDKGGNALITYKLDNKTGDLQIQAANKIDTVKSVESAKFKEDLKKFITDNRAGLEAGVQAVKKLKKTVTDAVSADSVQKILKEKSLKISTDFTQVDLKITYPISNKVGTVVGEIVLDMASLEISLVDKNDESMKLVVTDMMVSLPPFLESLDVRTVMELKADEALDSFKKTLEDGGFKALLAKNGMSFGEPKEDEDRIYYQLFDAKKSLVSTFTIEKVTGVVTVTDSEGNKNENLLFFDPNLKKKS